MVRPLQATATQTPLLSIGLPVYNGGQYLPECLDSLLGQTFTDFEILISDNASTDDTAEIVKHWQKYRQDPRIKYRALPVNLGAIYNFNHCLRWAQSPYFKWQAVDDLCRPDFLKLSLETLQGVPRAALACPRTVFIDEAGRRLWEHGQRLHLTQASPADRLLDLLTTVELGNASYGVTPTATLRRIGGLRDHPSSDLVLLGALALQGALLEVPEPLFLRRLHRYQSRRRGAQGLARWHGRSRAFRFEHWRVLGGFVGAIYRANLALDETIRCFWALSYWTRRYRAGLIGDLVST
jgi:glycosyltransferase involved in cell wall biosynthesis